jgi:hypothetical protein
MVILLAFFARVNGGNLAGVKLTARNAKSKSSENYAAFSVFFTA